MCWESNYQTIYRNGPRAHFPFTCKRLAFAPPLCEFGHIWTAVPEVARLPACEASSLYLLFRVNAK
jgi:hypothetical protein